jgi:hypothetical protein
MKASIDDSKEEIKSSLDEVKKICDQQQLTVS